MKEQSLTKNAILNIIRQAMTIVFPLVTFPYVSRVLGKAEFGKYNFAVSIVGYFALLAAFGLTNYAVREGARIRKDRKALSHLTSQLFSFNLLTSAVAYILLFFITFYSGKLNIYFTLIAVQSLCIILTTIGLDWINIVYEDFLYITIRYIIIQLIALIAIFLFVRKPDDTVIYCWIMIGGSYGGNVVNLFYIRKYVDVSFTFSIPFRKFFVPMSILFLNSLAVIIYVNSDITILGMFESDSVVGVYSFSSKIYNILKQLVNAVIVVAVPRLVVTLVSDVQRYRKYLEDIFNLLILILLPISAGLFMLSKSIILIVGGQEYLVGESVLRLLSFSIIFALISSIYTNCMLIIGREEKKILIGTSISAIFNIVGNLILIPYIGMIGAALTTVLAEFLNMLVQRYYSKKYVLSHNLASWKTFACSFLGAGIVVLGCWAINRIILGDTVMISALRIVTAIMVSVPSYLLILIALKHKTIVAMLGKFKNRM